jgi:hypothetical protein
MIEIPYSALPPSWLRYNHPTESDFICIALPGLVLPFSGRSDVRAQQPSVAISIDAALPAPSKKEGHATRHVRQNLCAQVRGLPGHGPQAVWAHD